MVTIFEKELPLENVEVSQFLFRGELRDEKYLPLLNEIAEKLKENGAPWVKVSQEEKSWRLYFSMISNFPIKIGDTIKWLGI